MKQKLQQAKGTFTLEEDTAMTNLLASEEVMQLLTEPVVDRMIESLSSAGTSGISAEPSAAVSAVPQQRKVGQSMRSLEAYLSQKHWDYLMNPSNHPTHKANGFFGF